MTDLLKPDAIEAAAIKTTTIETGAIETEIPFPDAPPGWNPDKLQTIDFLEGTRTIPSRALAENHVTPRRVPRFYEAHIRKSPHYERLKLIVEPSVRELDGAGMVDTSGEAENLAVPGLQHKYPQTGLMLVTEQCAAFCRYCFRKRFVGTSSDEVAVDYDRVGDYIARHPEMTNVLMSGGDPFMVSTRKLDAILDRLLPIPHLTTIRFGTKSLTFNPKRFCEPRVGAMMRRIVAAGKTPVVVAHVDHFAELSDAARERILALREIGVQFLNQSVLLKDVNDDADVLAQTFDELHALGVRPYYLFQTRPVIGASRFQTTLRQGAALVRETGRRLSGLQKTFRYIMSHTTGKIEIIGFDAASDRLVLKYHQAKDPDSVGTVFTRACPRDAVWFDDLPQDGPQNGPRNGPEAAPRETGSAIG